MLIGSGGRLGQECAHSALLSHPLGFVGRGKVSAQIMWPGMEARVRKNDGTLEAPSTQAVDIDGTYTDRESIIRKAILNRLRFGRRGGLLERLRANLCLRSQELDNASWLNESVAPTRTANTDVAPDGTTTADSLKDTSVAFSGVKQTVTITDDSNSVTFSFFIKKGTVAEYAGVALDLIGGTGVSGSVTIDHINGTLVNRDSGGPNDKGIESFNDDWWFVWFVLNNNNTGNTDARIILRTTADDDLLGSWDGAVTGTNIFWGFQIEQNSPYATSYIPTAGASVTRSADILIHDNTNEIIFPGTSAAWTVICGFTPNHGPSSSPVTRIWSSRKSAVSFNGFSLEFDGNGRPRLNVDRDAGVVQISAAGSPAISRGVLHTVFVTGESLTGDVKIFVNGKNYAEANVALWPTGPGPNFVVGGDDVSSGTAQADGTIAHMTVIEPVLSFRQVENANAVIRKAA